MIGNRPDSISLASLRGCGQRRHRGGVSDITRRVRREDSKLRVGVTQRGNKHSGIGVLERETQLSRGHGWCLAQRAPAARSRMPEWLARGHQ